MPASRRLAPLAYGLAALVIVLDQLSKHWVLNLLSLPEVGQVRVALGLKLTLVWNRGVSFGLLRANADLARYGLAAFSIIVAVVLATWAWRVQRPLLAVALGLVIGGAVGNVVDRLRFGAVADFIDASALHFPWVFNVADSAITVGVALLLLDSLWSERRSAAPGPASAQLAPDGDGRN